MYNCITDIQDHDGKCIGRTVAGKYIYVVIVIQVFQNLEPANS